MAYFSFTKPRAYLDWASAAPVLESALNSFSTAARAYGNPSSPHKDGVKAKDALEDARRRIARLAGVKSDAVIFTSGATESNAIAIQGRIRRLRRSGVEYSDMHVLYIPTMHASAVATLTSLSANGVIIEEVVLRNGIVDMDAFAQQLTPSTVLVCADAVCGETGTRFDTLRMKRAVDAAGYTDTALLHVDASQIPLVEQIERTRLGADLMTLDAQKVGAVRGIGVLIVPHNDVLAPITFGGGQEFGLRPGTEPVALAAAFAVALEARSKSSGSFSESSRMTRERIMRTILDAVPSASVIDGKKMAPHILNLQFPGIDTDYLVMLLDAAGFSVATRSACETDSEDGSHAVKRSTGDAARAASTLRISWGPETDIRDLDRFVKELLSSLRFLTQSAI